MNESDVKLRKCPFCGSKKAMPLSADRNSQERLFPIVRCMGCFTDVPGDNDDFTYGAKSAIKAWNTRHNNHLLELAAEALKFYANKENFKNGKEAAATEFGKVIGWANIGGVAQQTLLTLQRHGYGKE